MKIKISLIVMAVLGIFDGAYLSYEHFSGVIPLCPANSWLGNFIDCGKVLTSTYAVILGVPVAVLGLIYYFFLLFAVLKLQKYLIYITSFGLFASGYFMSVQIFILHAICLYCSFSALINLVVFVLVATQFIKNINSQKTAGQTPNN